MKGFRRSRKYSYAVVGRYDGELHYVGFDTFEQARRFIEYKRCENTSVYMMNEYGLIIGRYGLNEHELLEERKLTLSNRELLEKCRTNQTITEDDITGEYTESVAILNSWGKSLRENAIACDISLSDDNKTEHEAHVCTQEELDKLKYLQACKEHDLLIIQAHRNLGYNDSNYSFYRTLRNRIAQYDKYMYAIKTGDTSSVNLELVTPMGIMEEGKPKEAVQSNKKEVKPYDSLLDDEKAERINKCLNKL